MAPDTWSDDKIMDTTDQVASTPPIAIRLSDRATQASADCRWRRLGSNQGFFRQCDFFLPHGRQSD